MASTLEQSLKTSSFSLHNINKTITITHYIEKTHIDSFINSLSNDELKTLFITYEHLDSSFDLEKSISFIKWRNDNG